MFCVIPREARFIIWSRAKRACTTQASQVQRDFLLAINLSSLVGVRLDVIQVVTSSALWVSRQPTPIDEQSSGFYSWRRGFSHVNECFSSNRILMFCAQDFGIARGQTLRVSTKNCIAWSCFSVKSSVFGHRMPHFAVILWETEVTNVSALKFQVSVWLMR